VHLTAKRVERSAEASGAAEAAAVRDRAAAITARRLAPVPDKLYIAVDGTGVPVTAAETAGRVRMRVRTAAPAPARSSSPCSSPRTGSIRTGTRSATRAPPTTWPPSSPPPSTSAGVEAEGIRRGAGHVRHLTSQAPETVLVTYKIGAHPKRCTRPHAGHDDALR
jgi:hypothetical protein